MTTIMAQSSVVSFFMKYIKRIVPSTKQYKIGKHVVLLNRDHLLPKYQSRHRLYDRFLPYLCAQFNDHDQWVIDVGANVGDTAVAIAQASRNSLLCIEGNDEFFRLLQRNVTTLFAEGECRIICTKAIVGTGRFSGTLRSDGTTASIVEPKAAAQPAITLDEVSRLADVPSSAIAIIKVDTDGYDGDVILSATNIIAASRPAIFWENYFSTKEQMRELEDLYGYLRSAEYQYFWIFDNYGNLMLRECTIDAVLDLNHYVASQNFYGCTRSIFYTDILAATGDKLTPVRQAISIYRSSVIEQQ